MTDLRDRADLRARDYERPNQTWTCGHAREGMACRKGPDRHGRCGATFECEPLRKGDRWLCTRSPSAGGKCAEGPLPDGCCARAIAKCRPIRSHRALRGRVALWSVSLALGLVVVMLQGSTMSALISPGPLGLHHGEIADCGTCHSGFAAGTAGWVLAAFAPGDPVAESRKCLACHDMGEHAFRPHSMPGEVLSHLTRAVRTAGQPGDAPLQLRAAALFGGRGGETIGLECTTCHSEHLGRDVEQTAMANDRCQSCHSIKFGSFSEGHPGFKDYPFSRRTSVYFDHVSHINRHFEKAGKDKAPATCTDCHIPARDGRIMLVGEFSRTCAACHLGQIEGGARVGPKGVAFLVAPGLDVFELRQRGAAIGEWPEFSEELPTPFMTALLQGDASELADLRRIEALDLLDLTEASDEDIAAVERFAWRVKRLYADLVVSGVPGIAGPLAGAFSGEIDKGTMQRLSGTISLEVIRSAQAAWFPNLFAELERLDRGERVVAAGPDTEAATDGPAAAETGLDAAGTDGGESDDILSEGDDILSEDDDILSEEDDDILGEDEDILAEEDGDILGEEEDLSLEEEDLAAPVGALSAGQGQEAADEDGSVPEIDTEAWAALGGWYRQDYGLYYKPVGHADRFVRAWLDISGKSFGTARPQNGAAVFATLGQAESPGACIKCHSVDRKPDGRIGVSWQPRLPAPAGHQEATIFSHTTHFSLLHEDGCLTCHTLDPQASYAEAYKHHDPLNFASNFNAIEIETCASCHVQRGAGDSCLLCHQYHVGTFETHPVPTTMMTSAE